MRYEVQNDSGVDRIVVLHPGEEVIESTRKRVAESYSKHVSIKGFRPGKAPLSFVLSQHGDDISESCAQEIVSSQVASILDELKWNVLEHGVFIDKKEGKSLNGSGQITIHVECLPDLDVSAPTVTLNDEKAFIEEAELDKTLENMRQEKATVESLQGARVAASGDVLKIKELSGSDADKKNLVGVESSADQEKKLFWYEPSEQKGETDPLFGVRVGEIRTIEAPQSTPQPPSSAPKMKTVMCVDICKKVLPELNDAFADQVQKGLTLETLRGEIRKALHREKTNQVMSENRAKIIEACLAQYTLEVPSNFFQRIYHEQFEKMLMGLERLGVKVDPEQMKQLGESMREKVQEEAEKVSKFTLFSMIYAKKHDISVSNQELNSMLTQLKAESQPSEKMEEIKERLGRHMLVEKVVQNIHDKTKEKTA